MASARILAPCTTYSLKQSLRTVKAISLAFEKGLSYSGPDVSTLTVNPAVLITNINHFEVLAGVYPLTFIAQRVKPSRVGGVIYKNEKYD